MSTCCKIHDQVDRVTTCNLPTEVTVLLASVLEAAELDTMVLDSTVGETMVEVLVLFPSDAYKDVMKCRI